MNREDFDVNFISMSHDIPDMYFNQMLRKKLLLKGFNPMIKPMNRTWLWKPATKDELMSLPEEIKKKVTSTTMHFIAYSYFKEEQEKYYLHFLFGIFVNVNVL